VHLDCADTGCTWTVQTPGALGVAGTPGTLGLKTPSGLELAKGGGEKLRGAR
jgi:hypothetical protein